MPQLNGSETDTLQNASSVTLDGPTVAASSSGGESLKRLNGCSAANLAASWSRTASTTGNPAPARRARATRRLHQRVFGRTRDGNFVYEFVELYHDK
jgi:hypothetical protein